MEKIGKVDLRLLKLKDFPRLKKIMMDVYKNIPNSYWTREQIKSLVTKFPEGQVVITIDEVVVGCALSILISYADFEEEHTYKEITGNHSFNTHNPKGTAIYGIDVFLDSKYRGLRLGRRLYDYRKDLCEQKNLKCIVFGGRLPNYHKHAEKMTPREYINEVKKKKIYDPVLSFQLSNDFHVKKVLKGYLSGDEASHEFAALLQWDNIYYTKEIRPIDSSKTIVRLGLVQWQMRPYKGLEDLMEQVEYFVDAVSQYRCDFALFPEFFNAPLMAAYNHLSEADAIRELAKFTQGIKEHFVSMAISYNINIITGSMPEMRGGHLYNVGYLCKRNGEVDKYIKMHVTPDEDKLWGMTGGNQLKVFDTDCGKVGVLICYDVEFPELGRLLADQEMNILFVPFLTDTQNGYSRVRHCAQARAIENECYVAIAGNVGNLPKVHNMDIQFAQSVVFTPCDFSFPRNGIKAEATPNTEMILVAEVDLTLLTELHEKGSVRNLRDRRTDIYTLKMNGKKK